MIHKLHFLGKKLEGYNDNSQIKYARIAGILYLVIIVSGISSEVLVRSNLIVPGDAATTASNILASKSLYRTGFAADSIMLFSDVAIACLFYVLFKPVNRTLSLIACAFRLIQASIIGASFLNYYTALLLLESGGYGNLFNNEQLNGLVMLFTDMHSHGYDLGLLFFAISNFILGYLIIRSKLFPVILGYGLQAGAVAYLAGSYTRFLLPEYLSYIKPIYIIPLIAELSFCLYLLFKGIKTKD